MKTDFTNGASNAHKVIRVKKERKNKLSGIKNSSWNPQTIAWS